MQRATTLLALAIVLAGGHAAAQTKIYKWVLPDGSIQYSDSPQEEGAKAVELPPLQIYSAPRRAQAAESETEAGKAKDGRYDSVKVVSPKADESIRDNGGTVSVRVALKPSLYPDHTIEILMDGQPIGSGKGTSVTVTNVDRGTHSVSAVVKNAQGATVASAPGITFHLLRASRRN